MLKRFLNTLPMSFNEEITINVKKIDFTTSGKQLRCPAELKKSANNVQFNLKLSELTVENVFKNVNRILNFKKISFNVFYFFANKFYTFEDKVVWTPLESIEQLLEQFDQDKNTKKTINLKLLYLERNSIEFKIISCLNLSKFEYDIDFILQNSRLLFKFLSISLLNDDDFFKFVNNRINMLREIHLLMLYLSLHVCDKTRGIMNDILSCALFIEEQSLPTKYESLWRLRTLVIKFKGFNISENSYELNLFCLVELFVFESLARKDKVKETLVRLYNNGNYYTAFFKLKDELKLNSSKKLKCFLESMEDMGSFVASTELSLLLKNDGKLLECFKKLHSTYVKGSLNSLYLFLEIYLEKSFTQTSNKVIDSMILQLLYRLVNHGFYNAMLLISRYYMKHKDYQKAVFYLNKVIKTRRHHVIALRMLGVYYNGIKKFELALPLLKRCCLLGDGVSALLIGDYYKDIHYDEKLRLKYYKRSHELGNEEGTFKIAKYHQYETYDYKEMLKYYTLLVDASCSRACLELAVYYFSVNNDTETAQTYLYKALETQNFKGYHILGLIKLELGDFEEMKRCFDKAIDNGIVESPIEMVLYYDSIKGETKKILYYLGKGITLGCKRCLSYFRRFALRNGIIKKDESSLIFLNQFENYESLKFRLFILNRFVNIDKKDNGMNYLLQHIKETDDVESIRIYDELNEFRSV